MQSELTQGLIVRVTGGEVWVDVEATVVPCQLRGRFRRRGSGFGVVAGDSVRILPPGQKSEVGTIEAVDERSSWLSRYSERDAGERLIVANVERLFVVAALKTPPVHLEFIDRVLVAAERGHVSATIIANKTDLADAESAAQLAELEATYGGCGYDVLPTSAVSGDGIERLSAVLGRGVYAFVGESGVGKSSLLMRLDPKLELVVNEVGERTGRGRHTTTFSQLYPFGDGYLADTPGVQTFGFPGDDLDELRECFPEFATYGDCKYQPCSHSHEPHCGVKAALDAGDIAASRHTSYLHLLDEVAQRAKRRSR